MQWRPEPTHVEKCGDEVWVAEKFQSNSEIAGSLRNSFRASVEAGLRAKFIEVALANSVNFAQWPDKSHGGRALIGLGVLPGLPNSVKLRMPNTYPRESDCEC